MGGERVDILYVKDTPCIDTSNHNGQHMTNKPSRRQNVRCLGNVNDKEQGQWYTKIRWSKDGTLLCGIDGATNGIGWAWDFTKNNYLPNGKESQIVKSRGGLGKFIMKNGYVENVAYRIPLHQEIVNLDKFWCDS